MEKKIGITPTQAKGFLRDIWSQLFNHGWAEDYQEHINCNFDQVDGLLDTLVGGGDVNKYVDTTHWDEEYDWKFDDGGISSFGIEVVKIMRKHGLLTDETQGPKEAKIKKVMNYNYNCPHCNRHYSCVGFMPSGTENCRSCGNPIIIKEEEK